MLCLFVLVLLTTARALQLSPHQRAGLLCSRLLVSIGLLNSPLLHPPPALADSETVTRPATSKTTNLPSGLQYYDVKVGDGPEATEGKSVQFQWVLRRSNGYFVDSSGDDNFIYKVGNLKKAIKGIDEGVRGMRVGGVRRLNIPPALAFTGVEAGMPGPLPTDFGPKRQILTRMDREVWYFEIKMNKVK